MGSVPGLADRTKGRSIRVASLGPRGAVAKSDGDARVAAIEARLAARERSLVGCIQELESRLRGIEGRDAGRQEGADTRRAMLHEALLALRRERYCLLQARSAVATLAAPCATTLADLRDGFAPAPKRGEGSEDDARSRP